MDFTTSKKALAASLKSVSGACDKMTPILGCVLLTAKGENVHLAATDLRMSRTATEAAEVKAPGVVAVNARALAERVTMMPDGPVTIRLDKDRLLISAQGSKRRYALAIMSADDFPPLAEARESDPRFTLDAKIVATGLRAVLPAASPDEARAHLNAVLVEWEGTTLRFVSTDGHRLHRIELTTEGSGATTMLLALRSAHELLGFCESAKAAITMTRIGDRTAVFATEAGLSTLSTALVDATFPPWRQVVPANTDATATLARAPLMDALRAIDVSANAKTGGIVLRFAKRAVTIEAQSPEAGDAHDEVAAEYTGKPLAIGFNAKYLLDALAAIETEEITLGLGGELDPMRIEAVGDARFLAIAMPMKI